MKKLFIAISFIAPLLAACSSASDEILPSGERVEILPTTNIAGIEVGSGTRGGGALNSVLASAIDISIFRADETTTPTIYATDWSGALALKAQVATGGGVTFVSPTPSQYYLADGRKTKLIGVYPEATNWSATNGQVTYTIDGATDIMATSFTAESVKGGTQPVLAFGHLLTQIQISVIAETDAAALWGNVTAVSVTGRANSCVVQLPMPNAATAPQPTFSGTTAALSVCHTDGTAISTALTPTTTEQDFGICMIAPITTAGGEVLPLSVTTSLGGVVSVSVPASTYVAGTAYKIQLKLTAKGIHPTATVTDWTPDPNDPTPVEM